MTTDILKIELIVDMTIATLILDPSSRKRPNAIMELVTLGAWHSGALWDRSSVPAGACEVLRWIAEQHSSNIAL